MKTLIKQACFLQVLVAAFFILTACSSSTPPENDDTETVQWFEGKSWLNGLQREPHETIDKQEFKKEYDVNPEAWDKAFAYLKNTDLAALKTGRHPIDGDNVFALVTQGAPKSQDTAAWESHQRHIDIHCVITGKERIAIEPLDSVTAKVPYDTAKDIAFYTGNGQFYQADANNFFIVFPPDAHCPGVAVEGYSEVKKLVIKIKKRL